MLYFLHNTKVLSFYIDVVLTLSIEKKYRDSLPIYSSLMEPQTREIQITPKAKILLWDL